MMIQLTWLLKAHHSSSMFSNGCRVVRYFMAPIAIALSFFIHTQCQAEEPLDNKLQEKGYAGVFKYKINDNFTVRGWRLTPNVYFGQTKAFGNTGYGLLVDEGQYAYGLIDQKISILKSF